MLCVKIDLTAVSLSKTKSHRPYIPRVPRCITSASHGGQLTLWPNWHIAVLASAEEVLAGL